jgi:cell division protein FtsA
LEFVEVRTNLGSSRQADDVIGLLDIGTSKTVCVIVAVPQSRPVLSLRQVEVRVLGSGVCASRGMKGGTVFELHEAEQAVREAVAQAERAACGAVEDVVVAVACGRLKSATFTADTRIGGRVVGTADIDRLMAAGRKHAERDGRTLLHMNCISYRLDGTAGIGDPLGLAGESLGSDLHAVTADDAPLRNMVHVVERAYLSARGLVPAPYASALAASSGEERQLGVLCLDIGAGTTTVATFAQGHLLSSEVVPIGGNHVTFDIAQTLSASVYEAERIKKDHVSLARAAGDDDEVFAYALAGDEAGAAARATKGQARAIVRDRMLRLFTDVAERIERANVAGYAKRVVLTGGASEQAGLGELAADFFGRRVRIARNEPVVGLPPGFAGPAYSTAVGLVQVALDPSAGTRWDRGSEAAGGYLQRMGQWLRESF